MNTLNVMNAPVRSPVQILFYHISASPTLMRQKIVTILEILMLHASLGITESLLPQDNVFHGLNDLALHDITATFPEPFQDLLTQDLLAGLDGLDFDSIWNDTQFPNSLLHTAPPDGSQDSQMNPLAPSETRYQEHPLHSQDHRLETESESGFASRLPSIEPERPQVVPMYVASTHDPGSQSQETQRPRQVHSIRPWKISLDGYARILDNYAEVREILPNNFTLPSKHTLSRFLEGYFRGFAIHMPFLHPVTFSAASISVELLLSLSAVGALYRFQPAIGYQLYAGAQALISWRTSQRSRSALDRLTKDSRGRPSTLNLPIGPNDSTGSALNEPKSEGQGKKLQLLQAMVVIMAMASWGDHDLTQDALGMSTQIAFLARELRISDREKVPLPNQPWSDGIQHEERRRTLFAAYALLNLQSVAFNVPPLLLNQEVAINLPGCASTWQAPNAAEWSTLQDTYMRPGPFQEKLSGLLSGKRVHVEEPLSSFGNYVLIHGLLQHVLLTRNVTGCLPDAGGVLCDSVVENVQLALRAWQESWEATYESTTDPSSPKGPLGFNSTAILRLVYIRLSAKFGPSRQLLFAREPWAIVEAFSSKRAIKAEDRSPHLDQAVLQCIHALSIPVRVGIAFVARTQTMNWSVQHALCNLECAFLLTQWLLVVSECVEASGLEALRVSERRLVNVIVSLVRETELGDSFDEDGQSHAVQIRNLASSTMLLWAQMFKGYHVFDMVQLVGSGLAMLAERLGEQPASSTFELND
ncbi:hypothetical protein J7T55_015482 [Diaporthe amygdali]|uniref:uncharacterized protein n=1 Tax=Phomopsis amygdali TaxID=1214568 RepID=UPI0022FDD631|nr:uncharacterized protein J7T55_015482 [Diaporthe amygdali]KAJ0120750.1 hypothetical protein J7T55_015482 [Diaporthe amygdali]